MIFCNFEAQKYNYLIIRRLNQQFLTFSYEGLTLFVYQKLISNFAKAC